VRFDETTWLWVVFNLLVLGFLALDLGVFHRKAHAVSIREAAAWSAFWVGLALSFNVLLFVTRGSDVGLEFLAGYLIEKSLSVDNVFVFALVFSYFAVPAVYQHRVLFWGVVGALVMRGVMIFAGASLLKQFHWVIFVFGALLIVTGIRMALVKGHGYSPEKSPVQRLVRKLIPVVDRFEGQRFFVRSAGRLAATPLFMALVAVETTDLIFAVDSIPAIFAVTDDPFIVYTSNVFAILGLRSLYFLLAGAMDRFAYLKYGISAVLVFVGFKMLISDLYKVPIGLSLAVIVLLLAIAIGASLRATRVKELQAPVHRENEAA
jgi:tellurite resistance protein TerC